MFNAPSIASNDTVARSTSSEAFIEKCRRSIAVALFLAIILSRTSTLIPGISQASARNCCSMSDAADRYWSSSWPKTLLLHATNGRSSTPVLSYEATNLASWLQARKLMRQASLCAAPATTSFSTRCADGRISGGAAQNSVQRRSWWFLRAPRSCWWTVFSLRSCRSWLGRVRVTRFLMSFWRPRCLRRWIDRARSLTKMWKHRSSGSRDREGLWPSSSRKRGDR